MVSKKRLKGHGGKHREDEVSKAAKYGGLFILVIMVMSIGGFALMSSGGGSSNSEYENGQNFPLTEGAFQNPSTGESYWGAILNNERFIFTNGIEGYEDFKNFETLATAIKSKSDIKIQIKEDYISTDSIYLIEEKVLPVFSISSERISSNETCDENTLVFTNTISENSNCLEFVAPQGEETQFADIFTYHMIKDFQ